MAERTFSRKCANCRERSVELATLDHYELAVAHDGRTYPVRISPFVVPRCAACGHVVINANAEKQIDDAFHDAAELLRPQEILRRRQELDLSQATLADLLGVAVSTLSRWETGAQIQQRSLDRLMRLFFESAAVRAMLADRTIYGARPMGVASSGVV